MRQLSYLAFSLALFGLFQWPLYGQPKNDAGPVGPRMTVLPGGPGLCALDGKKLIFAIEASGDSMNLSNNLQDVVGDAGLPLRIQMVNWSSQPTIAQDYIDHPAQLRVATQVAAWTRAICRDAPNAEIYLVGHGAGGRIALAAAEMLPEKSVERIILIAPGVWRYHDLRPALVASRGGIDNFWSNEDYLLARLSEKYGNADGFKGPSAGVVGFCMPASIDPLGAELYRNGLHQHRFHEDLCGQGGHCAWLIRHNMKKCIVPLFFLPQIEYQSATVVPPPTLLPRTAPHTKMKDAE